ncbi:MAG: glycerol kinase, partial [Roseibium sp.]|nr:glycerol kinase [Roseibium sp.]
LGAAWLAGSRAGIWPGADVFAAQWKLEKRFEPALPDSERQKLLAGWQDAVQRTRTTQD